MVSTRRKSYQPSPGEGDPAPPTTRLRHTSLSDPPVAASPRRSRRASSLTPLETEDSSAESAQARGHRTKALLERYRSEAAGTLRVVEEEAAPASKVAEKEDVEAGENGGEPAEVESAPAEAMEVDDDEEVDVEKVEVEEKSAEEKEAARRVAAAQRVLASVTEVTAPAQTAAATTEAPALTRIRPTPKPRGIAKSGRFWKSVRTKASKVVVRDPVSYEERMQERKQQRVVKDLENQLKNERKQKMQDLRKRREYNAKKATENALKAEVYQVVKNPNKIKRMKKKQLRLLQTRDTTVVGKSVLDE